MELKLLLEKVTTQLKLRQRVKNHRSILIEFLNKLHSPLIVKFSIFTQLYCTPIYIPKKYYWSVVNTVIAVYGP